MILYKEEYNVGQEKRKRCHRPTMLAKKKEKDVIDRMLDQIDFHGMTAEGLSGEKGLLKQLTSCFIHKP